MNRWSLFQYIEQLTQPNMANSHTTNESEFMYFILMISSEKNAEVPSFDISLCSLHVLFEKNDPIYHG